MFLFSSSFFPFFFYLAVWPCARCGSYTRTWPMLTAIFLSYFFILLIYMTLCSMWKLYMTPQIRTYRSGQTVQTQIRLLLEEQADQWLHSLLFHLHHFDKIRYDFASFLIWGILQQRFLASQNLGTLRLLQNREIRFKKSKKLTTKSTLRCYGMVHMLMPQAIAFSSWVTRSRKRWKSGIN